MNELKPVTPNPLGTIDSRDVAEMVDKQHKNLLADIRGYIEEMEKSAELKVQPGDFFVPSYYFDANNQDRPCYLITKMGCEFVANKLTGEKGTKFTAAYVTRFNQMENQKKAVKFKAPKTQQELTAADKRATAMMLNAKSRVSTQLLKLYEQAGVKAEYQALAISDFYAEDGVNLPRIALQGTKVTYDKGMIAERLGVYSKSSGGKSPHAHAIGGIINELDISEDEREAVPFCHNGHDGTDYQYAESVIDKVHSWLEAHHHPATIQAGGKNYYAVYQGVCP